LVRSDSWLGTRGPKLAGSSPNFYHRYI
jgi:hypothetical protein